MQIHENILRFPSCFFHDLCSLNEQSNVLFYSGAARASHKYECDGLASVPQIVNSLVCYLCLLYKTKCALLTVIKLFASEN